MEGWLFDILVMCAVAGVCYGLHLGTWPSVIVLIITAWVLKYLEQRAQERAKEELRRKLAN
jgi:hypothetical protein